MSTAITGNLTFTSNVQADKDGADNAVGTYQLSYDKTFVTAEITKSYNQELTVNTSVSLDLTALSTQVLGSFSLSVLKHFHIQNDGTQSVTVGGGTNAVIPQMTIPAGGVWCVAGVSITVDSTHKIIAFSTPSSSAVKVLLDGI